MYIYIYTYIYIYIYIYVYIYTYKYECVYTYVETDSIEYPSSLKLPKTAQRSAAVHRISMLQ